MIYFSDLLFFIVETSVTRSPARDYCEIMSHFAFLIFSRNIEIVCLKQFFVIMRLSKITMYLLDDKHVNQVYDNISYVAVILGIDHIMDKLKWV